jgi:hypothetical protein
MIYRSEILDNQERYLALETPTSETTHVVRERGKHNCKTISRQRLSN